MPSKCTRRNIKAKSFMRASQRSRGVNVSPSTAPCHLVELLVQQAGKNGNFSFLSSTRTCSYGKQTAPLMGELARWREQQGELAALLNGAGAAPKASWFDVSKSCLGIPWWKGALLTI